MARKRRRSESFNHDANKRLAALDDKMLKLQEKEANGMDSEVPNVIKRKKHKKKEASANEEESVPIVKFNKTKKETMKMKDVTNVLGLKKNVVRSIGVEDSKVLMEGITTKLVKKKEKKAKSLQRLLPPYSEDRENVNDVNSFEQALDKMKDEKRTKKQKKATSMHWQRTQQNDKGQENDMSDVLKQELGSVKPLKKKKKKEKNTDTDKSSKCHFEQQEEERGKDLADPLEQALSSLKDQNKKKKQEKKQKKEEEKTRARQLHTKQDKEKHEEEDEKDLVEQGVNKMKDLKRKKKKQERVKETKAFQQQSPPHQEKEKSEDIADPLKQDSASVSHPKKQVKNKKKRKSLERHLAQHKEKGEDDDAANVLERALSRKTDQKKKQESMSAQHKEEGEGDDTALSLKREQDNVKRTKMQQGLDLKKKKILKRRETQQGEKKEADNGREQTLHEEKQLDTDQETTLSSKKRKISAIIMSRAELNKNEKSEELNVINAHATSTSTKSKKKMKKQRNLAATNTCERLESNIEEAERAVEETADNSATRTVTSPSPKRPASRKTLKKVAKAKSAKTQTRTLAASTDSMTPIAASLAKDTKKKDDISLPGHEIVHQSDIPPNLATKTPLRSVTPPPLDPSCVSEREAEDNDVDFEKEDLSFFSRLIDSAARERWELVEVGRLVRLFAADWQFETTKTAQFLRETCPELVNVEFLEGLDVNLSAKQLVQVFEIGSGNAKVLMNKMASALENGHLSVQDASFVSTLEQRVALMESNAEVLEFLHPLLESLSTVRDVGALLKQLCQHWHLERKTNLVQQILLTSVFDDLEGNQDDICLDLPDLSERLDFPSRLDQEDMDENGNLKGLVVDDDSEVSEEGSESEDDEDESGGSVDSYEGETDSDDEVEVAGRSRNRHRFIEDEADVGEEDDEDDEEHESDGSIVSRESY